LRNIFAFLLFNCFALLFFGCEDKIGQTAFSNTIQNKKAKIFHFTTLDGDELKIALHGLVKIEVLSPKFQNKPLLFDFWATWCPPCIEEIPQLIELRESYKEQIELIGILAEPDKSMNELKDFVNEYKISYPIVHTNQNMEFFESITNLTTLPFKVLYDKKGSYVTHYYGAIERDILEEDFQKALRESNLTK